MVRSAIAASAVGPSNWGPVGSLMMGRKWSKSETQSYPSSSERSHKSR